MIILGIDPGTATTGFGVIEAETDQMKYLDCGVITTPPGLPMPERLAMIAQDLRTIMKRNKPQAIAVEELFFAKNVTNALSVGQARGVALLVAAEAGCAIAEYKPHHIKLAVAGYGRASKQQVQEMVKQSLHLAAIPQPDDAADGLAVAMTHAVMVARQAPVEIRISKPSHANNRGRSRRRC